jgi:ABC-type polysaccharide/polyol phosphate export permease
LPTSSESPHDPSPTLTRRATRSGIPPLRDYFREAWRFKTFALYWSAADIKARNFDTWFGRFWHYLNPLLFGLIYFVFVGIVSDGFGDTERLAFIISNLYVWLFMSTTITSGVSSIQGGAGGIMAQSAIPRAILPIASTLTSFNLFLRSLVAYIPIHFGAGRTLHIENLWLPVLAVFMACLALGLAMLTAVLNVYIRDVSRLLPHMLRLWMYLSPVIWEYTRISGDGAESLARLNPMYPVMASWTIAFGGRIEGSEFSMVMGVLVFGAIAMATLAIGFLVFVAREDDFAVRN